MPKKSKKRARQAKRRTERREAKRPELPEPTPAERLLGRIHQEAARRRQRELQQAQLRDAERLRQWEREKARGER
jgi:hypothetical protein